MPSFFDVKADDILNEMNQGKAPPPQFVDRYKIGPENDPNAKLVIAEIQRIVKKLLLANKQQIMEDYGVDVEQFNPRILLSYDDHPNAFTISSLDKYPVIVVHRGLIKAAQSEDEIAGVLGHEIHHNLLPRATHNKHQGQLGECACDIWTVKALRNAGYQAAGMIDFFKRGGGQGDTMTSSHPAPQTRIIQMGNTEVVLDKTYGKTHLEKKPLLPKSKPFVQNLPDQVFISQFEITLNQKGFDKTPRRSEKLRIILACLKEEVFKVPASGGMYSKGMVIDFLIAKINSLQPIPDAENQSYFNKLMELRDWLINSNYEGYDKKFKTVLDGLIKKCNLSYRDHLQQLEYNLSTLTSSYTYQPSDHRFFTPYDSVLSTAKTLVETLCTHYPTEHAIAYLRQLFRDKHFERSHSSFTPISTALVSKLKENETIIPSWDQAVRFALKEYQEKGTTYIASALYAAGITQDPRLKQLKDKLRYQDYIDETEKPERDALTLNDEGQIINPYAVPRTRQEHELLQKINWQELRDPPTGLGFAGFTQKYHRFLKTNTGVYSADELTEYAFAEEFLKQLVNLPPEEVQAIKASKQFHAFFKKISFLWPHEHMKLDMPYVQFILNKEIASQFFASDDAWRRARNALLAHAEYYDYQQFIHEKKITWTLDTKKYFATQEFATIAELEAFSKTIELTDEFERNVLFHEASEFLQRHTDKVTAKDLDFFTKILTGVTSQFTDDVERLLLFDKVQALKNNMLQACMADASITKETLTHCIEMYHTLSQFAICYGNFRAGDSKPFFSDHIATQQALLQKIMHLLSNLELPSAERLSLLERIIFQSDQHEQRPILYEKTDPDELSEEEKKHYLEARDHEKNKTLNLRLYYNETFPDPLIRDYFIHSYVDALTKGCNQDEKGIYYDEMQIKKLVDGVLQNCSISLATEILSRFTDNVVAQRGIATYIKIKLQIKAQMATEDHYIIADFSYRWINETCSYPQSRQAFLTFLLTPASPNTCRQVFNEAHHYIYEIKYKEYDDNIGARLMLMHREFWSSDPLARAAIFQKLLYSKNIERETRSYAEIEQEASTYVMDRVLPSPSASVIVETDERKVVNSYLAASTEAERSTVLSMMLASQEPVVDPQAKKRNGQILKIVLDNLGPAGTKMAQAINSHPATPADIREDTQKSKSMANKPNRWQLFDLLDECYGRQAESIRYVGDILGAGAYGVTVPVEKYQQQHSALTLLRSYAQEKAKTEFHTLYKAAEILVQKDPKYDPVIGMVKQANSASEAETDMRLAEQQDKIAQKLYNTIAIQVGNNPENTYTFKTAPWLGFGPRYKETAIMPGTHFMDLPHNTEAEKATKRDLAIAILTVELLNLVGGKAFDHDRHGAQQRIQGKCIGQFDFGGISLKPPSNEEKKLLGEMIGRIMRDVEAGIDMLDALQKAMRDIGKTDANKEFLATVERAVLALNEYASFVTKEEMISIFAAVRKDMDPTIAYSLGSYLVGRNSVLNYLYSGTALSMLDKKLQGQISTPITIHHPKKAPWASIGFSRFFGSPQQEQAEGDEKKAASSKGQSPSQ